MATQGEPEVSLVEEDPVRAIRNCLERIRKLHLLAAQRATTTPVGASVEEELVVVERALQKLEPT